MESNSCECPWVAKLTSLEIMEIHNETGHTVEAITQGQKTECEVLNQLFDEYRRMQSELARAEAR